MAERLKIRISEDTTGMQFGEPRFACLECEDTGYVTIYHPEVVATAMRDPNAANWARTCAVRCTCASGDAKGHQFRSGRRVPTFGDRAWHINAKSPDAKAEAATFDPLK